LLAAAAVIALQGAAGATSLTARGPVSQLAFDEGRVAFSVQGRCGGLTVWSPVTKTRRPIGRSRACMETSTGSAIGGLTIGGRRVLWVEYTGGNIREWTLRTATTTRRWTRRLAFVARDVDEPAPIVVGDADVSKLGDLLPYAVDKNVVALHASGARRFAWTAPARVLALGARDGELAVATAGGLVTVLDASGNPVRREQYATDVDVVAISGNGLLVQRGRTLELRESGATRTWGLSRGARLQDAEGGRAYYVAAGRVRELKFTTGKDRVLARGTHARAEGRTLVVASARRISTLRLSA
jgi:hypothetical protein